MAKQNKKKKQKGTFVIEGPNEMIVSMTMSKLFEVESLDHAIAASDYVVQHMSEGDPDAVPKYALAHMKMDGKNYLASLIRFYDAIAVLRVTDLDTKQHFVPRTVWVAMEDKDGVRPIPIVSMDQEPFADTGVEAVLIEKVNEVDENSIEGNNEES